MKHLFTIFFVLITSAVYSQKADCSGLKEGKFKSVDETTGTTIITRKGSEQIEENVEDGVKMTMKIVWVSECVYELRNLKVIKGKLPRDIPEGFVVTTEILEVNKDHYKVRVTSNLSDIVFLREISILN